MQSDGRASLHATEAPAIAPRSTLLIPVTDAVVDPVATMPLASLLTANVVPQGEIVNLLLKPSRWFILLNSMRFAAVVILIVAVLHILGAQPFLSRGVCVQFGMFLVAGRIMWSLVQWMGRFYILTDMRLLRVCGIFDVRIESRMLREIDDVKLYPAFSERMLGRGSIDIFAGEQLPMTWQTISTPDKVLQQIRAAIHRVKHNGGSNAGASV